MGAATRGLYLEAVIVGGNKSAVATGCPLCQSRTKRIALYPTISEQHKLS